jgi:CRP-like cAMP-binding protein
VETYIGGLPAKTFRPGEVIFHQGEMSRSEAYLVDRGRVEVRQRSGAHERVLRTLAKGDLLGEVALLQDAPHSATAVAIDQVTLIVIPSDRLESMVRTRPALALALIRQLARMAGTDTRADDTGTPSSS